MVAVDNDGGVGRIIVGKFPTPGCGPVIECGRIGPAVDFGPHHLYIHHQLRVRAGQLLQIAIQR